MTKPGVGVGHGQGTGRVLVKLSAGKNIGTLGTMMENVGKVKGRKGKNKGRKGKIRKGSEQ